MKNLFLINLLIIFSTNISALNIDCDGKIFRGLVSDQDSEEIKDPGGMMQTKYSVVWSVGSVMITEDMLSSILPRADMWNINRKDLSYVKSEIRLSEDTVKVEGQCKIWEKPKDNIL